MFDNEPTPLGSRVSTPVPCKRGYDISRELPQLPESSSGSELLSEGERMRRHHIRTIRMRQYWDDYRIKFCNK